MCALEINPHSYISMHVIILLYLSCTNGCLETANMHLSHSTALAPGRVGHLGYCHHNQEPDKWWKMDGWMNKCTLSGLN